METRRVVRTSMRLFFGVHRQREETVRAARLLVHLRLADLAPRLGAVEATQDIVGRVDLVLGEAHAVHAFAAFLGVLTDLKFGLGRGAAIRHICTAQ